METITEEPSSVEAAVPAANPGNAGDTPAATVPLKIFLPLLDNGNGSVMASFMIDHAKAFAGRKVVMIRASDSHANRGMNKIANAFLDSDCDVWINIDADVRHRRVDVDNLLSHAERGVPLAYGIYPKKEDAASPCLCTFATVPVPDENGLAEVRRCGRGFMLVARRVLEAMKEDNGGPALRYHNHGSDEEGVKIEWDFFPSGTVTGEFSALGDGVDKDGYPIREWISEDWYFCERARQLGFKTMVDQRIALGHVGSKDYRFGMDQVVRTDSNISNWKHIHGWFDYERLYRRIAEELANKAIPISLDGIPIRFVEVGCWLGRSIAALHQFIDEAASRVRTNAAQNHVELHVVDTFEGAPANDEQAAILQIHGGSVAKPFRANMAALGVDVNVHVKPSVEAAADFSDGSIDAVFIDGDHRYEFVRADIAAWLPKVKHGGIICGHDIDEPGVDAAVREVFGDSFETIGRCWSRKIG